MKFKKIIPYNLKKILPILGLAGASVVTSCEKPSPYEPAPSEVDLYFDYYRSSTIFVKLYHNENDYEYMPSDLVKYYVDHPDVKNIYLVPSGNWGSMQASNVLMDLRPGLQSALDYSPKIRGKGDVQFYPGSLLQSDSLWLVQNGWTVKSTSQKQH